VLARPVQVHRDVTSFSAATEEDGGFSLRPGARPRSAAAALVACSWLYAAWVWVSHRVRGTTRVSRVVCVAWSWVSSVVCVAGAGSGADRRADPAHLRRRVRQAPGRPCPAPPPGKDHDRGSIPAEDQQRRMEARLNRLYNAAVARGRRCAVVAAALWAGAWVVRGLPGRGADRRPARPCIRGGAVATPPATQALRRAASPAAVARPGAASRPTPSLS
jgi:hypothetical protein